jgi:DNA repair protein RecN (Recombination protein N)
MLTTLRIKNLALVSDLTLELQPGYNAVTGETGAGKSIIIGALNLVLGERADRNLIRSGCDNCSVEAVFEIKTLQSRLKPLLEENGLEPCEDGQLVLKRTFTNAGTNRQFVNGSPTTLSVLSSLGEWLVDMHGPHDHQSLLHTSRQLAILDAFGNLEAQRDAFGAIVSRRAVLQSEKAALIVDEKTYAQQLDLLRHQAGEIAAARLNPDEEESVKQEHQRASNANRLLELCRNALSLLEDDENSLITNSGLLGRTLQDLQRTDSSAEEIALRHGRLAEELRELHNDISRYSEKVVADPAKLQELEERLGLIQSLKRKYGATLADVIAHGAEAAAKLEQLEKRDSEVARINGELKHVEAEIWRAGEELSKQRRKIIPQLSKSAVKQLRDLGFAQCHFDVAISTLERKAGDAGTAVFPSSGLDSVEFQFAPNAGEPPRALRAIASSGEMARVMLALKTVLAQVDEVPVLVFDEVDANVGGATAGVVGEKMRQIARQRQVLCITHLAPVASHASAHYMVSKQVRDGRTISEISLLSPKERVTELSRMLGGLSDAARKHAEELLRLAGAAG